MERIVIEPLKPGEIREASVLLGRAFITDPTWAWVFQGQIHRLETLFRMTLEYSSGQALVAKESGQIVGVFHAVRSPQCYRMSMSPVQFAKALPLMFAALRGSLLRAIRFFSIGPRHDPKQPHWHLGPVGVLPERQGQGIGSRLLERFCEHVDQLGEAGHLETGKPENLRFYERFGFSVTGETQLDDMPIWFMWRPPRGEAP